METEKMDLADRKIMDGFVYFKKEKFFYFIDDWMNVALPVKDKVKQDEENASGKHIPFEGQCEFFEKEAVKLSLTNLLSYPFVRDGVSKRTVSLKGGYYDFVKGSFELWGLKANFSAPLAI